MLISKRQLGGVTDQAGADAFDLHSEARQAIRNDVGREWRAENVLRRADDARESRSGPGSARPFA